MKNFFTLYILLHTIFLEGGKKERIVCMHKVGNNKFYVQSTLQAAR